MSTDGPTYACCNWSLHIGHSPECNHLEKIDNLCGDEWMNFIDTLEGLSPYDRRVISEAAMDYTLARLYAEMNHG